MMTVDRYFSADFLADLAVTPAIPVQSAASTAEIISMASFRERRQRERADDNDGSNDGPLSAA